MDEGPCGNLVTHHKLLAASVQADQHGHLTVLGEGHRFLLPSR
jgi:hypothetical protein